MPDAIAGTIFLTWVVKSPMKSMPGASKTPVGAATTRIHALLEPSRPILGVAPKLDSLATNGPATPMAIANIHPTRLTCS